MITTVFFVYFIFSERYIFEEHGIYGLDITGDSCSGLHIIHSGDKTYIRTYNVKGTWYMRCNDSVSGPNFREHI
jgi:hypothetical protein